MVIFSVVQLTVLLFCTICTYCRYFCSFINCFWPILLKFVQRVCTNFVENFTLCEIIILQKLLLNHELRAFGETVQDNNSSRIINKFKTMCF